MQKCSLLVFWISLHSAQLKSRSITLQTRVPSSSVASRASLSGAIPMAGVEAEMSRAFSAVKEYGPVSRLSSDRKFDSSMLTTSAPKLRQPYAFFFSKKREGE